MKDRNFSDFNKEILYGEIGAVLGAAILSTIMSHFSPSNVRIAQFAVLGSMIGGSSLFLLKKIRNKIRRKEVVLKSVIYDLKYFVPVASLIAFFVTYPILYSLTKFLVKSGWEIFPAGAVSELAGFSVFICCVNIYRFALIKLFKKNIA